MYRNHTQVSEIHTSYIVKQEICMRPTPTSHTTTTQSLMILLCIPFLHQNLKNSAVTHTDKKLFLNSDSCQSLNDKETTVMSYILITS